MGIEISHLNVRRSVLVHASAARVWREFTSFEALSTWFGRGHTLEEYEPRLGGSLVLSMEISGQRHRYGGPILVLDEAHELTWENNWEDPGRAWPVPTLLTVRLRPLYDATLVELFHHGFERLGADAADNLQGFEEGWDLTHLAALRERVEA